MSAWSDFSETVERHPALIALAVLLVAVLAYLQSKSGGGSSGDVQAYSLGGTPHNQTDPGAVAIEQAAISAGAQNVSVLASLVGLTHESDNQLNATNTATNAARDASLAGTAAGVTVAGYQLQSSLASTAAGVTVAGYERDAALASTAAARDAALAKTAADLEASKYTTDANVTINSQNTSAATEAARINAQTQAATIAANAAAAKAAADNQNFAIQAQKDIARANDNTNIFGDVVGFIGHALSWLF